MREPVGRLKRVVAAAHRGLIFAGVVLVAAAAWGADPGSGEPGSEGVRAVGAAEAAAPPPDAPEATAPPEKPGAGEAGGPAPGEGESEAPESPAPLGQKSQGIEEIVVTGVRLEDTLQSDPVSATTFGKEELRTLRIENVKDIADYTANFEVNTAFAASNPNLFIRGIGLKDYNANAAGAVAIYQDDINISLPAIQLGQMFDVANVQVLRGPQGSIRGRDATAGAVYITSEKPGDELAFNGSFTYGNYNTIQAEGGVSVPLIDDLLSARLAFTANFRDGYTKNACSHWNPQAHPEFQDTPRPLNGKGQSTGVTSYLVDQETLLAEYQKDKIAGILPQGVDQYSITQTNASGRQRALDAAKDAIEAAGLDPVAKYLTMDGVCMINAKGPGYIVNTSADPLHPEGTYVANAGFPQLEDFQTLNHFTNNVDNWAGRTVLRLTPPTEGPLAPFLGSEWLLNIHGFQNDSDSFHQQMLGANPYAQKTGFYEDTQSGFSERAAADATHGFYEGTRNVKGLDPGRPGPNCCQFPGFGGSNPYVGWYNSDGKEKLDTWGLSARGFWEPGDGSVTITSLTGYDWYGRSVQDEGDATPLIVYPALYEDDSYQASQEVRVEGNYDQFQWTAGFYFLYAKLHSLNQFPSILNLSIAQTWDQELYSGAPYLGATYLLTEELSLQAGIRYNVESKSFHLASNSVGLESGQESNQIPDQEQSKTWQAPTGDLTLSYAPGWSTLDELGRDQLNLYAKYTHGTKGGHYNAGLTISPGNKAEARIEVVKPEFIDAVELGFKSSWFDDRLTLNADAFRYWYQDYQVFDIQNGKGEIPFPKLENADAHVLGAEVDMELRPLPGVNIQSSFGYLDTAFDQFTVVKTVGRGSKGEAIEQTFDYQGHPLISAPKFSFSVIADYTIPLFDYGFVIPQYSATFRSKQYLDPQKLDPISQDSYWQHNARLAYRTPDEKIEVAGWVQNFLDEPYKIDAFDVTRQYSSITEVWSEPRTYGISLSYNW